MHEKLTYQNHRFVSKSSKYVLLIIYRKGVVGAYHYNTSLQRPPKPLNKHKTIMFLYIATSRQLFNKANSVFRLRRVLF